MFNIFYECGARCAHLLRRRGSKMYTSDSIGNSQRMLTDINESGARAEIRI